MKTSQLHSQPAEQELVLTKAVLNMVHFYGLTGKELAEIIGISEAGVSRLQQGTKQLSPTTKEGEIALLLLRIYRSLNSLLGNNHDKAKAWLTSFNSHFNQKPLEMIKTVTGLVDVLHYLDAMRGKI